MGKPRTSLMVRGLSGLIALLFALNLLSVIPISENHPKDNGITHSASMKIEDSAHKHKKQIHDHVEHCGMVSCAIAFSDFNSLTVNYFDVIARFQIINTKLNTLHHTPSGRPPIV